MRVMNMSLRPTAVCIAVFLALAITGCASTKKTWHKLNMTQDDWAIDSTSCKSRARKLAEDDLSRAPFGSTGGIDNAAGYSALMSRYRAQKNMESIFRRCLQTKGYRLITPKPKPAQQV